MATASLSTFLWPATATAASQSLFAMQALPSPSARFSSSIQSHSSTSRRTRAITSLAFQTNAFSRKPIATAYSNAPYHKFSSSTLLSASPVGAGATLSTSTQNQKKPIPTILLAGFLGSGKTSTLKHLLENNASIKVGTIVNDVASVNIDAKLISNSDSVNSNNLVGADDVLELQNGCACCSLADELLTSVERLTLGGERELDAIVVELSGVADPVAVRDNWEQARLQGHPATRLASLQRTVTLIDACTFGTDWMTWDTAGDRSSWTEPGDDCVAVRKVPELLAEQVEAADLLLVNKIDLAEEKQTELACGVARGLNEKAALVEVEFGRVGVRELLGKMLDDEDVEEKDDEHLHGHGHLEHEHEAGAACTERDCTDTTRSHEHPHASESDCIDPECTDSSHSHEHTAECADADCNDTSHSHAHEHTAECDDDDCTDTSHSHSHEHKTSIKTAADHLGITSFVYRASTPFNSPRLLALLNRWPVPIKDSLDVGLVMDMALEIKEDEKFADDETAFVGVLRSKGFCWMAPSKWSSASGGDVWRHDTAMYWSHAGKHFGITSAGKWWGTLGEDRMKPYFADNMEEYDRIMREDWVSEEWGDRRQELVFIGANLDEGDIRKALDDCLCTGEEMEVYRAQLRNYIDTTYSTAKDGPSLFDVGSMDHIDQ